MTVHEQARAMLCQALDVSDPEKALSLAYACREHVGHVKVGLQLFIANGPLIVQDLISHGFSVFLDLKLYDIPNTVAGAAEAIDSFGANFFSVHGRMGAEGLSAVAHSKGASRALAVTELTSRSSDDFDVSTQNKCLDWVWDAVLTGLDGIICAPNDLAFYTARPDKHLERLLRVTPGIRPAWAESNDQKRVMTPREAVIAGSDLLVIGRPLNNPPRQIGGSPIAARVIHEEICAGLAERTFRVRSPLATNEKE